MTYDQWKLMSPEDELRPEFDDRPTEEEEEADAEDQQQRAEVFSPSVEEGIRF